VTSILRNLPRLPDFVVAWDYPLMKVAADLNPEALRRRVGRSKTCMDSEFVEACLPVSGGVPHNRVLELARGTLNMPRATADRYLQRMVAAGLVVTGQGLYWRARVRG